MSFIKQEPIDWGDCGWLLFKLKVILRLYLASVSIRLFGNRLVVESRQGSGRFISLFVSNLV